MEIFGTIKEILPKQTGGNDKRSWQKQDFILETLEKYPRKVCLTNWQGKIEMNKYQEGDQIRALLNVESKEYNGKWYTDLKVWKMEKIIRIQTAGDQINDHKGDIEKEDGNLPF